MKKVILILFFVSVALALCAQDTTIDRGSGIMYFSGDPGYATDTTCCTELAYSIISGEMWYYNRDSVDWKKLIAIDQNWAAPSGDPTPGPFLAIDRRNGNLYQWTGASWDQFSSGGAGTVAGNDGAVQYNNAGVFGGDDTNFYWDDGNNRLGIGTNSPSYAIEVNGQSGVLTSAARGTSVTFSGFDAANNANYPRALFRGYSGSNIINFGFYAASGQAVGVTQDPAFMGVSTNSDPTQASSVQGVLQISTSKMEIFNLLAEGSARAVPIYIGATTSPDMYFGTSGNIGVQTISPGVDFDINGTARIRDGVVQLNSVGDVFIDTGANSPESVVTADPGSLYLDTTNGQLYVKNTGTTSTGWVGIITNPLTANLQTSTFWISGDGDNEGLYVTSSGTVGVGTSSTEATLHAYNGADGVAFVSESVTSSTNSVAASANIKRTSSGNMTTAFGVSLAFQIEDDAAVANTISHIAARHDGADNTGEMRFYTYTTGSQGEALLLDSDQDVFLSAYDDAQKSGAAVSTNWGLPLMNSNGQIYRFEVSNIIARMNGGSASITAGTDESIAGDVAPSASTDISSTSDWAITNDSLQYTGTETRAFKITATVDGSASAAGDYDFSIAKNGTVQTNSTITQTFLNAGDFNDVTLIYYLSMTTNDVIQVFVDVDAGSVTYTNGNTIIMVEPFDN